MKFTLEEQVRRACRHLLSEIDRDPSSPTMGCFDRRYWAWKLTDFPEATFQRNLANLAWYMQNDAEVQSAEGLIRAALIAGLRYTARIQHRDGSFDQAYPYERSFGATGFMLPDLIKAYLAVKLCASDEHKGEIENCLRRAARFLTQNAERHGLISNHLAGAALGLMMAGDLFPGERFEEKGKRLLEAVLSYQSPEGWFPEYGGADPGYQTLCMHYLAQIYQRAPDGNLEKALIQSLDFLRYFLHPDGSFGGEYGSRRTEIYYPGGIALLAGHLPVANAIHSLMRTSIENLTTVTLEDVDMGNMAPLLSSSILALNKPADRQSGALFSHEEGVHAFKEAGLAVYTAPRYYAVWGASNGGVLKIYDMRSKQMVLDDCGALALVQNGALASTQATRLDNERSADDTRLTCASDFHIVGQRRTTPFNYLMLRLLNLTVMRIGFLNETVKKMMVSWLIETNNKITMRRVREISFLQDRVEITDRYTIQGNQRVEKLTSGGKFNTIHMASSRYYAGQQKLHEPQTLDAQSLNMYGSLEVSRTIDFGAEKP